MRRLHLFEWEDQPWLPNVFRDFITDHLGYFLSQSLRVPVNQAMADRLKPLLEEFQGSQIIDLCAGAGGPLLKIRQILSQDLGRQVQITLTDLYPNIAAFDRCGLEGGEHVTPCYEAVSAFDVPERFSGLRTLFTSLHHFPPAGVQQLLADAAHKQQPIAIFEPLERTPRLFVLTGIVALIHGFLLTPFVGRMTLQRFCFTYLLPLAPAILLWDGLVSVCRTYRPAELLELARNVGAEDYVWEAGRFETDGPVWIEMPTTFLIGKPVVRTPVQQVA